MRNFPGAGGEIGIRRFYRAKPDGYTIGQFNGDTLARFFGRTKKIDVDFEKLTWLAQVGEVGYALLLRKGSKFKTLKDLQQAKRITREIPFSVGGWIHGLITAHELGIPFEIVSGYPNTNETLAGFLRDEYDVLLYPVHHRSVAPYFENGEIRPLLNLAPVRPAYAPNVPTAKAAGYNFTLVSSRYIAAPPGTPAKPAKFLEKALLNAMNDKTYKDHVKASSAIVIGAGDANRAKKDVAYRVALLRKYQKYIGQSASDGRGFFPDFCRKCKCCAEATRAALQ